MNKRTNKNVIILIASIVVILIGFGGYKYSNVRAYNKLVNTANQYMSSGEYDKAISLLKQAETYKNDENNKKNISLAEKLKGEDKIYNDGLNSMQNEKYLDAIKKFEKISKENNKFYKDAEKNIEKCKELYIQSSVKEAEKLIKEYKFNDANKYIEEILKIDPSNKEINNLKDMINDGKKQLEKRREEERKQEEMKKNASRGLTCEDAINIVKEKHPSNGNSKICYEYDHDSEHDGNSFYVIHVYENMETHTATIGWYGVDKKSGKVYNELFSRYEN